MKNKEIKVDGKKGVKKNEPTARIKEKVKGKKQSVINGKEIRR